MDVFKVFRAEIENALRKTAAGRLLEDFAFDRISVEPPRNPEHGDISSNAAMVAARGAGRKPRDLARSVAEALSADDRVEAAEVAGPGFVNLRLAASLWQDCVRDILETGPAYGDAEIGAGRAVNVEYVSANPTGPMHVGHARGAVIGDALAALLEKVGHDVTREYYVNDAGAQVDQLARSVLFRCREALGEDVGAVPEGLYPGDYLVPLGETLAELHGADWAGMPEEETLPGVRDFAIREMMKVIREDLEALGVRHDVFRSERGLHESGAVERTVEELEGRGLVCLGVLKPPKGQAAGDWEEREQLLFRSSRFGDDSDRALGKADGSWTYFAADMAYHVDKFRRGFSEMIDVWGADHKGYVRRMQAAVEAATVGEATLDVRVCNLVNLFEGGEPVKMSKRAGTFVTLREVVDRVGADAVRFLMLTRSSEAPLDFDLEEAVAQSRDNPVFYVQYAHARACSALRHAAEAFPDLALGDRDLAAADMSLLDDEAELSLVRLLAGWPRLVETAALAREPHRVAYYLQEVAAAFHSLWNRGNARPDRRFLVPGDRELSRSRLALARAMAVVLSSGLAVMGIRPVEEMR